MDSPLISIITVTFNAQSTIERTMRSIASQTFKDYELIVVDGASTDRTIEVVRSIGPSENMRIVSEPDNGLYDAMNKGIGLSSGKYLIFLNAGDKFHTQDTLQLIATYIRENGMPGVVYGQTDLVNDRGEFVAERHLKAPEKLEYKDFSRGMVVCHQAFVVQKTIAPYFSLKYRFSADYEWCIICLMHSEKNVYVPAVLIDYLVEGMTTAHRKSSLKERFRIMSTYYGFWLTLVRHISFIGRFLKHRKTLKKAENKERE